MTQGAQFEISIDGKPRSHRERREVAIEAAEFLKRKFPLRCRGEGPAKRRGDRGRVQGQHRATLMPLTLRPTGLASPVYGHLQDWTIFEDGKPVDRIYEDVSERVVGQPLTGARDLRDSGAYCDYGQISCKDRV